jgi:hypothetical protein
MTLQPSRRPLKELGAAGMKILKVDDDVESFFFFFFFFFAIFIGKAIFATILQVMRISVCAA